MTLFITVTHVFLCLFLILIILLQPGKDSSDIFGGGGQGGNKMYGARAQSNPLSKATTLVAILFMFTSITLAFRSTAEAQANKKSQLEELAEQQAEAQKTKMTFELPKFRLVSPEDLYEPDPVPSLPDLQELPQDEENEETNKKDDSEVDNP